MNRFHKTVTHVCTILSFGYIVLWILDFYNPMMDLLHDPVIEKGLFLLLALSFFQSSSQIFHKNC